MKGIKHVFFDLDHTLWDYNRNAQETLFEIYENLEKASNVSLKKFVNTFYEVNDKLWYKYNDGQIDRETLREARFVTVFQKLAIDVEEAKESSDYFISNCSSKPHLIPFAKTALNYLGKKYQLHIITNGFEEIQPKKLKSSGIENYFKNVVTSEGSDARKPSPKIFEHAMQVAGSTSAESVMIGDNPKADIHGARDFGMRTILLDPSGKRRSMADYSIECLSELIGIL